MLRAACVRIAYPILCKLPRGFDEDPQKIWKCMELDWRRMFFTGNPKYPCGLTPRQCLAPIHCQNMLDSHQLILRLGNTG